MTPLGVELIALQILLAVLALISPVIAEGIADPFGVDIVQDGLAMWEEPRVWTPEERVRMAPGGLYGGLVQAAMLPGETVTYRPPSPAMMALHNVLERAEVELRYGFDPATGLYPNEEPWRPGPAPTDPSDVVPQADPDIEDLAEDEVESFFSGPPQSEDERMARIVTPEALASEFKRQSEAWQHLGMRAMG